MFVLVLSAWIVADKSIGVSIQPIAINGAVIIAIALVKRVNDWRGPYGLRPYAMNVIDVIEFLLLSSSRF